jgi:hypothetical protein
MESSVVTPRIYDHESRTAWGAIFGGTFVYIAVMSTFGLMLSSAIFSSSGWTSLGFTIWNAIVAIIALYIAGRATSHLARIADRGIGAWHGLITFGMSFIATVLVLGVALSTAAPYSMRAAGNTNVAGNLIGVASGGGWALWCAMFLGFIAAAIGGSQAADLGAIRTVEPPAEIRRVA